MSQMDLEQTGQEYLEVVNRNMSLLAYKCYVLPKKKGGGGGDFSLLQDSFGSVQDCSPTAKLHLLETFQM